MTEVGQEGSAKYSNLSWYRKSGVNSILMLVHFITLGFVPLLWITCFALLTGDIYYNKTDVDGSLKRWSRANKVIAFLLVIGPLLLVGTVLLTIAFS